ncbi:MAG: hypothetical protein AMXMBFR36_33690 [Acidobacteriota bacterium]
MSSRWQWRERIGRMAAVVLLAAGIAAADPPRPSTFSIVAADPATGEVGVAVASRFFAVGAVVPFARAGVGAVATQASANTSYGPAVLDLLAHGVTAREAIGVVTRNDEGRSRRQLGAVSATGDSATFSGPECNAWAGGRSGPGYAVQGNILTGEPVVAAMEKAFLASAGAPLAERLFAALAAGDAAGGDSRGKQSAVLLVARAGGGYGGFDDRAIDVRVDDHPEPIVELGRLVDLALVNDLWNRGWAAFLKGERGEDLKWQEATLAKAEAIGASVLPEVLYDVAVIRLANGDAAGARAALDRALALNPKLAAQAAGDKDLAGLNVDRP